MAIQALVVGQVNLVIVESLVLLVGLVGLGSVAHQVIAATQASTVPLGTQVSQGLAEVQVTVGSPEPRVHRVIAGQLVSPVTRVLPASAVYLDTVE